MKLVNGLDFVSASDVSKRRWGGDRSEERSAMSPRKFRVVIIGGVVLASWARKSPKSITGP
jgi:hypothetical protein